MAQPTIDQTFITKFERDTHLTYRQMGSKYRGLVRTDADVNAEKARFFILGSITTSGKGRGGDIPVSNPEHTYKDCTMQDEYVATLVDKLDLTKLSTDVRGGYVKAAASAFGITTDKIIVDAMTAGATLTEGDYTGNMTRNFVLDVAAQMDENEVPRDGRRFWGVSPAQWSHLHAVDEFTRADYNGPADLPFKKMGNTMKTWNDFHFFVNNRCPGSGTAQCKSYAWHMDAVGHGINADVSTTWDWENLKSAWSMAGSMSMGACVIDPTGLIEARLKDNLALPA